jgi:hypothetical protein
MFKPFLSIINFLKKEIIAAFAALIFPDPQPALLPQALRVSFR